jgi:hypothetical protein
MAETSVALDFGELGWRSLFHRNCPVTHHGGIVAPDGLRDDDSSWHALPDGSEIRAYVCKHCGVRFYAGVDKSHHVRVIPREQAVPSETGRDEHV